MKKLARGAILLVVFLVMLAIFAGCDNADPINIVIVDGNARANCPSFSYSIPFIDDLIYRAALTYGSVAQVSVEGLPRETANFKISAPATKGLTSNKLEEIARDNQAVITAELQNMTVESEEADVLLAIQLGARTLHASHTDKSTDYLVVLDSMLATEGILDYSESNLLDADAALVVEGLQARGEIPDLTDIDIYIFGCGDTIAPQRPLNAKAKSNLQEIWKAVFVAGGAKSVTFMMELPTETQVNDMLPKVSTISVITDKLVYEPPENDESDVVALETPPEIVRLDDAHVTFIADEAILKEPDVAKGAVLPFIEYLQNHPEQMVLVAGSTASAGTREGCMKLSRERAQVIASLLIDGGCSPSQIISIGLGQEQTSLRVVDLTADGRLVETEAVKNRAVFLILLPSSTADELLEIGN